MKSAFFALALTSTLAAGVLGEKTMFTGYCRRARTQPPGVSHECVFTSTNYRNWEPRPCPEEILIGRGKNSGRIWRPCEREGDPCSFTPSEGTLQEPALANCGHGLGADYAGRRKLEVPEGKKTNKSPKPRPQEKDHKQQPNKGKNPTPNKGKNPQKKTTKKTMRRGNRI